MNIATNESKNKNHYDNIYSRIAIETIIQKVKNYESFLDDAVRTDTSWHGLYHGGLMDCLKGKTVLELGCGDGLNALIMAKLGANVVAIDISEQSRLLIDEANSVLDTKVKTITGDFQEFDLIPSSYDYIIGKSFLHHLTHDLEAMYLAKVSKLLKQTGEARFFEPAINSKIIDTIRWMIPVPGRPSILDKNSFQKWKANDPHPVRDNSTKHYVEVGKLFFNKVDTEMIGSIERFCRVLPAGRINRDFRRWAHRIEPDLPSWLRYSAARSQLIIYRDPKVD